MKNTDNESTIEKSIFLHTDNSCFTEENDENIGMKNSFLLFMLWFLFYFGIGLFLVGVNGNQSNFLFGADCGRAWADIVDIIGDHYRISVHPLFLSLVQTVYHLFEMLFVNRFIAVLALESFVGAFTVVLFNHLLTKLFIEKSLRYAMICVFGGSFSQMVFSTVPETFIFASGFLLFWYVWVFSKENSQNTKLSTCSLVFFGICCLGITITNYLLFALGLIYLLLNRSESFKRKCCYFFEINTLVFILSMCISAIQAWFWKSPLYITQFLHAIFKTGEFEEVNYMSFSFTVSKFKDLLKQMFLFPTLAPEMVYAKLLNFGSYSLLMKFMIIAIISSKVTKCHVRTNGHFPAACSVEASRSMMNTERRRWQCKAVTTYHYHTM